MFPSVISKFLIYWNLYSLGFLPIIGPPFDLLSILLRFFVIIINPYREVPKLFVSKIDQILNADKSSSFTFRISRLSLILIAGIAVTEAYDSVAYVGKLDVKYEIIV